MIIEGTLLGAVLGASLGVLAEWRKEDVCVSYDTEFFGTFCDERAAPERHYVRVGALAGLAGALVGGVFGSKRTIERWVSVPLDFRSP